MPTHSLTHQATLVQQPDHLLLSFSKPHRIISSAVLNGGVVMADHLLNMKVAKEAHSTLSPQQSLELYAQCRGCHGTVVGMMTAASMNSMRIARKRIEDVEMIILVTTGLSNARRAGDRAEYRQLNETVAEAGTINLIVLTTASLTPPAMVEAVAIATEAKAAALQELGIHSPISNKVATDTGTDSTAIVFEEDARPIAFCGKHTLFGELIGNLVIDAIKSSIEGFIDETTPVKKE